MPGRRVHRKWSRRLGVPDDVSRAVDELIDRGCVVELRLSCKPEANLRILGRRPEERRAAKRPCCYIVHYPDGTTGLRCEVGHDWIKSGWVKLAFKLALAAPPQRRVPNWVSPAAGGFALVALAFYRKFGVNGVKAFLLHGILDHTSTLLGKYGPGQALVRGIAWLKCGGDKKCMEHAERKPLEHWLRRECGWLRYLHPDIAEKLGIPVDEAAYSVIEDAVKEILELIASRSDEVLSDLLCEK